MALASVVPFSKWLFLVGDGASPEVFAAPCGLTSRGFNRTAETNDTNIPDCANEDAPSWLARDVVSLAGEFSGSGVLDNDAIDVWDDWFQSGAARNVQIVKDTTLVTNGRKYTGRMILTALNITGERGSKVNVEVTAVTDGAIVIVPASA